MIVRVTSRSCSTPDQPSLVPLKDRPRGNKISRAVLRKGARGGVRGFLRSLGIMPSGRPRPRVFISTVCSEKKGKGALYVAKRRDKQLQSVRNAAVCELENKGPRGIDGGVANQRRRPEQGKANLTAHRLCTCYICRFRWGDRSRARRLGRAAKNPSVSRLKKPVIFVICSVGWGEKNMIAVRRGGPILSTPRTCLYASFLLWSA